jgi:hypothetical protein
MRTRIGWLAALVAAWGLLAPGTARAQEPDFLQEVLNPPGSGEHRLIVRAQDGNNFYEVPPPSVMVPSPLNQHLDQGGWFVGGQFVFYNQTNPLRDQLIGFRGLTDRDGSVHAALGLGNQPGFIGSHAPALDVNQVSGPSSYQPGFNAFFGYRFRSGLAVEFSWLHLTEQRNSATASLQPNGSNGLFQAETFLSSGVFNYPENYFGPGNKVGIGNVGAVSGIWNGASLMTEEFLQRFEQVDITFRYPLQQTECWRMYGLFGPRAIIMWERFWWRTVDTNVNGVTFQDDAAVYTNIVSNRLYGIRAGIGNEWFLGDTPAGAFSISLDLQAAALLDFVKGRSAYELGDRSTIAHRNRNFITLAPEVQGNLNLWWYPYEGIQVSIGYNAMVIFNTMAAPQPVDFNYGALVPAWEDGITRLIQGFNAGIAFIF